MSRLQRPSSKSSQEIPPHAPLIKIEDAQSLEESRQQKLLHLQTVLLICQLNATLTELTLTLEKTFCRLEDRILSRKFWAFEKLTMFDNYQRRSENKNFNQKRQFNEFVPGIAESIILSVQSQEGSSFEDKSVKKIKIFLETDSQRQIRVFQKCKTSLEGIFKLIQMKLNRLQYYSFYKMNYFTGNSKKKIIFEQQDTPRLEVINNQKNKIIRRANQRVNRKSFSLDKPEIKFKHQEKYVAVKLNVPKNMYSDSSKDSKKKEETHAETNESSSFKASQKYAYELKYQPKPAAVSLEAHGVAKKRTTSIRERKILKSGSSHKLNSSVIISQRLQKRSEFNYLKKKYQKLIAQFSEFSEKFLKVITQEDDYVP